MTYKITDDRVVIDLPGKFVVSFEGGSIAQGQYGDETDALLGAAYKAGEWIRRGKGFSLRLTLPRDRALEPLRALGDTADLVAIGAGNDLTAAYNDSRERFAALAERSAALAVAERVGTILSVLNKEER